MQACALEALRRLIMKCKDKDTSMKQKTFDLLTQIGNGTYSKSVFRSVRKGSHRLLKAVGYRHLDLYRCFRCAKYVVNHSVTLDTHSLTHPPTESTKKNRYYAENGGITADSVRNLLSKYLKPDVFQDLILECKSIKSGQDYFANLFHSETRVVAKYLKEDPVLILYTYLSLKNTNWIPTDSFVMKRFNSPDWLERFVGVLIVMRYDTEELCNMRKVIFPRLAASELISDVRDLLEFSISVRRFFFE